MKNSFLNLELVLNKERCVRINIMQLYLRQLIKDPLVASLVSTSSVSSKKIVHKLNLKPGQIVVEYGPGSGEMAEFVRQKISPGGKIFLIEQNKKLAEKLSIKFQTEDNVYIFNDSAENVASILQTSNIVSVDRILSSIPFSFLTGSVARQIVATSYKILKPGGLFAIFQMTPLALGVVKPVFKKGQFSLLPFNLPPLWLWVAKK